MTEPSFVFIVDLKTYRELFPRISSRRGARGLDHNCSIEADSSEFGLDRNHWQQIREPESAETNQMPGQEPHIILAQGSILSRSLKGF